MTYTGETDKLKALTDRLEAGVKELFASNRYRDYLKTMASFHQYSARNSLLIFLQKPEATRVAGFEKWKSMERSVNKGEKGLQILAPYSYKKTVEVTRDEDGTLLPSPRKKEVTLTAFKPAYVFDISQTNGRELPQITHRLTGTVGEYEQLLEALRQSAPCPVTFEPMGGSTNGYYAPEENRIAIREGLDQEQTIKTLIHEMAHAKLGHGQSLDLDRQTGEVQAESVAYVVCQHLGIDSSRYSFGYVAGWSRDKELSQLQQSLGVIQKAAADIISSVEGYEERLRPIKQGREQAQKMEVSEPPQAQAVPVKEQEQAKAIEDIEILAETLSEDIDSFFIKHIPSHHHLADSIQKNLLSGETEWIHKILDDLEEVMPRLEGTITSLEKGMDAIQKLQKAAEQSKPKKPSISQRLDAAKKECAERDARLEPRQHTTDRERTR